MSDFAKLRKHKTLTQATILRRWINICLQVIQLFLQGIRIWQNRSPSSRGLARRYTPQIAPRREFPRPKAEQRTARRPRDGGNEIQLPTQSVDNSVDLSGKSRATARSSAKQVNCSRIKQIFYFFKFQIVKLIINELQATR
ncbi:MAG: hypothetical protein WC997_15955 [Porticoccaceae bacterium]